MDKKAPLSPNRREGWFDKRVSIKEVIFLIGLVFALGQTWAQFGRLRDDVVDIQVGEQGMATAIQVETVAARLRQWIDRAEAQERLTHDEHYELLQMIHELGTRLGIAEDRITR